MDNMDYPTIENNVILSTGCAVLGKVTVKEGTVIGAHSLVIADTEPHSLYIGCPAKKYK